MEYFVGLDVSLRSCAMCVVDIKGKVYLERELPCEVEEVADCLAAFEHPIARVGFEAGAMSQHLFFVGMVVVFALITGIIIVDWVVRRAKAALSGKFVRGRKASNL
ncbi:MAG: hypothetical protein ABJN39_11770 [Sulfitobacter sp.]|uniref:hypothetical protein n=1 Tax=Alphaproteobacteria TaxID=28211 RepID=UPI0029423B26|nr:hypothetical protein [Sulfitobacter sp. LC.270.F.C4]WOI16679.1 hypothetical protein R1T45_09940 [Sulfitobacter sp. LC.270.F.C4]